MLICSKCGREGDGDSIKRCPSNIPIWKNMYVCRDCYVDIKNGKQKDDKSNTHQCDFCGSRVNDNLKTCPYCKREVKKSSDDFVKETKKIIPDLNFEEKEFDMDIKRTSKNFAKIFGFILIFVVLFLLFVNISQGHNDTQKFVGEWEMREIVGLPFSVGSFGGTEVWRFNGDLTMECITHRDMLDETIRDYEWRLKDGELTAQLIKKVLPELKVFDEYPMYINIYTDPTITYKYQFSNGDNNLKLTFTYQKKDVSYKFVRI